MRHLGLWVWVALAACSSEGSSPTGNRTPIDSDAAIDGGDSGNPTDGGSNDAAPEPTLIPSNLPPEICNTPGTRDLIIARGSQWSPTISADSCDARIDQEPPLPPICVLKYARVGIAGHVTLGLSGVAVAVVATDTFTVESGGRLGATGPDDPRGAGPDASSGGAGGGGHIGPGGTGGVFVPDGERNPGGSSYGPVAGTQLVAGAKGGKAVPPLNAPYHGLGGAGGGAFQIVACRHLDVSGEITASGTYGMLGARGLRESMTSRYGTSGGGGGSGGTLLIEATGIVAGPNAKLLAIGGVGGDGGDQTTYPSGAIVSRGGPGGAGGTGSSPAQPGGNAQNGAAGGGGGGGAVGRVIVNVPAGTTLPTLPSDPPASVGVIGTR